jgi:hypothetical protein
MGDERLTIAARGRVIQGLRLWIKFVAEKGSKRKAPENVAAFEGTKASRLRSASC